MRLKRNVMTEDDLVHLRDAIAVAWSARRNGNHPRET
jgi:hypothetical protein